MYLEAHASIVPIKKNWYEWPFPSRLCETFSHAGALLFKMEAAVRMGYTNSACIDEPCAWNQCFVNKVTPAPIHDIKFDKESTKEKLQAVKRRKKVTIDAPTDTEKKNSFLNKLQSLDQNIVGWCAFNVYANPFVDLGPKPNSNHVPQSLRTV